MSDLLSTSDGWDPARAREKFSAGWSRGIAPPGLPPIRIFTSRRDHRCFPRLFPPLRRPRLRGARLGDGRDGGVLAGKMVVTTADLRRLRDVDEDEAPVTIKGEPLSATIIRERRCDGGVFLQFVRLKKEGKKPGASSPLQVQGTVCQDCGDQEPAEPGLVPASPPTPARACP